MEKQILALFKDYTKSPFELDRILVSSFLNINSLDIKKNSFLKKHVISKDEIDFALVQKVEQIITGSSKAKFELEDLMQVFEFIISPKEKIVTGAVYTPLRIREYIVNKALSVKQIETIQIADISCGCAGFLMTAALLLKEKTNRSIKQIVETNLFGLDIASYSIERSKIILGLLALLQGEDQDISYNLFLGNALSFEWANHVQSVKDKNGFDCIIGNPPYVCSRNIDEENKALLEKWQVTSSGHPDLYIPFFEVATLNLNPGGFLGYITVNTFFKSINGRELRKFFSESQYNFSIIDFRNEQVFEKRNTYTCICFITKVFSPNILYAQTDSHNLATLKAGTFHSHSYIGLDDFNGWNFGDQETISIINKLESFEVKLFDNFSFSTGIATLKNSIYKFRPTRVNSKYFYFQSGETEIKIEKGICREIINSNKVTTPHHLRLLKEQIIFPYFYNPKLAKNVIISEQVLSSSYPNAYNYLLSCQDELSKRDKGAKKYEAWYAYGRNQSLDIVGIKLFFPHITNGPSFVLSKDKNLLFYNGEAIICSSEFEIKFLKKILESSIFWFYITKTSKPYSSNYYSMGKNYMKQFSIPKFSQTEKTNLIKSTPARVLTILLKKYGLKRSDIPKF